MIRRSCSLQRQVCTQPAIQPTTNAQALSLSLQPKKLKLRWLLSLLNDLPAPTHRKAGSMRQAI